MTTYMMLFQWQGNESTKFSKCYLHQTKKELSTRFKTSNMTSILNNSEILYTLTVIDSL